MNTFMRCVSLAVLLGMANLTMVEALAAATGGNGGGDGGGAPGPGPGTGGGFNPTLGVANGACGTALRLPNPASYANALEGLEEISRQTQTYLEQCGCATQACVADALDTYAVALQKITPRLPPALRALPAIVHQAAQKARVAPTLRVAVKVLRATVAVVQKIVRKTIELMRAHDPDTATLATRGGGLVASTLDTAATVLERADTL